MRPKERVVWQEIAGEAVLLDLDSERYFGLNAIGTEVWRGLSAGLPLARIIEDLLPRYAVDAERLTADVAALVTHLRSEGLLAAGDD
jgi:hypothetical protein